MDYFTALHSPGYDYNPSADPLSPFVPVPSQVKNIPDPSRSVNRDGLNVNPPLLSEDDVPSEGLINVNTAGWKVLAALPLVLQPNGQMDRGLSEKLAKRIVYFRDVDDGFGVPPSSGGTVPPHPHGPFKSLLELCLVPQFAAAEGNIDMTGLAGEPGPNQGEFSPIIGTGDFVRLDFEEKYLNLTRISNLLTLHSDCYTVYLQVQGWRDAGSANARLMVQRRLAFIVDRSHVTPLKPTPTVYNVQVPASGR